MIAGARLKKHPIKRCNICVFQNNEFIQSKWYLWTMSEWMHVNSLL